jgi:hypothetical protein
VSPRTGRCHCVCGWGGSRKEHDERLQKVLKRCIEEGINLNRKKCKFAVQEAKYLGHVLSKEGVKVDEDKVRAVKEMQKPQNKEEVHRFLGMINYLAKSIPNCSAKTEPLRKLLKKEVIFEWSAEQEVAYQKILTDLSHPPVLALFDHKKMLLCPKMQVSMVLVPVYCKMINQWHFQATV